METTINIPKMNHKQKDMARVFGLSLFQKQYVTHVLVFTVISSRLLVDHIFGNDLDDAPLDLVTESGHLEKALSLLTNDKERAFCMFIFQTFHKNLNLHMKIVEELENQEVKKDQSIGDTMKTLIGQLATKPIDVACKYIKECEYDFDKYIAKACPKDKEAEIEAMMEKIENFNVEDFLGGMYGEEGPQDDE